MSDLQGAIIKTRIAMRDLGRKIDDVKKKLSELAPKQERRTEVRVSVAAGAKLTADLVVKYQVGSASWQPHYDARLTTGTADKSASLVLTRRPPFASRPVRYGRTSRSVFRRRNPTGRVPPRLSRP